MAPFQTSVTLDDNRDGQEIIEVQILPQVSPAVYTTVFTWNSWMKINKDLPLLELSDKASHLTTLFQSLEKSYQGPITQKTNLEITLAI